MTITTLTQEKNLIIMNAITVQTLRKSLLSKWTTLSETAAKTRIFTSTDLYRWKIPRNLRLTQERNLYSRTRMAVSGCGIRSWRTREEASAVKDKTPKITKRKSSKQKSKSMMILKWLRPFAVWTLTYKEKLSQDRGREVSRKPPGLALKRKNHPREFQRALRNLINLWSPSLAQSVESCLWTLILQKSKTNTKSLLRIMTANSLNK